MSWIFFVLLFATVIKNGLGLDCIQIPSTSIFAGSTVHLPGPSDQLQIIPANFNCPYKINAPGNTTHGLSANVVIRNGLKGVNDYIRVTDIRGFTYNINSRSSVNETYVVIPGAEMMIQVVTKSVYMQSMFEITVEYLSTQIGPTFLMKTGGEMNYIDMGSLRDGKSLFNSVTFVGTEPISMTYASPNYYDPDLYDCYVIDGTIDNQTEIHNLGYYFYTTKSNAITILSPYDKFLGLVFNPKSEADKFSEFGSLAVDESLADNKANMGSDDGKPGAVQVVNFATNGIIMDKFESEDKNCTAYVVHGPPNNSSKVLLDLSTSPKMPHSFDVKYFSVVFVDCDFQFFVRGYSN